MYASVGEFPALMFYAGLDEIDQWKVREAAPLEREALVHVKGGIGGNSLPAAIAYRNSLRAGV
jgi:hypothetical protein